MITFANKILVIDENQKIKILLFFILVFMLTRQVPFSDYNFIMNIALVVFFIVSIKSILGNIIRNYILHRLMIGTFIILSSIMLYSIFIDNNPNYIIRFYLILSFILLAYFIDGEKVYVKIFFILTGLQASIVIGLEFYLMFLYDEASFGSSIRHFFLASGWGDVYTYGYGLWNIQLRGNALLPFAFFISLIYFRGRRKIIVGSFFLASILFAGNFAFIVGTIFFLTLYLLYNTKWTKQKIVLYFIVFFIFTGLTFNSLSNYLEQKIILKSESSNPVRIDQFNVLVDDLSENLSTILIGQGLGNTIDVKTSWRDYNDSLYFELQSIYFLNQLGIVLFCLFILINILLAIYFIKYKLLLIAYGSYIIYSLFNPYFLDTNQVVVIIVLISLRKVLDEKNILNTRNI